MFFSAPVLTPHSLGARNGVQLRGILRDPYTPPRAAAERAVEGFERLAELREPPKAGLNLVPLYCNRYNYIKTQYHLIK